MRQKTRFYRFFPYFGAKHRAIHTYAPPKWSLIIEPFAGSAAYATRYHWLDVVINEIDPTVYSVWDYLIKASTEEIAALPHDVQDVWELPDGIPQEAQWLIGFWLQPGANKPAVRMSTRAMKRPDTAWSEATKLRVAQQAGLIKHWQVTNADYSKLPNCKASWFIDPPYIEQGRNYVYGSQWLDYDHLSKWCLSRPGQCITCEQLGAVWLPFRSHASIHSSQTTINGNKSAEVVWEQDN